jgi:glycerol-3-phosphate dehydrogenase
MYGCGTFHVCVFFLDSPNLSVQLIQKHGMTQDTAEHLARAYGGRAWDVCELSQPTQTSWPRFGVGLAPNYPYQEAEVIYACREYACTVEDVLSRRTRLAFLNKDAALAALDRVADIMAMELGWSDSTKQEQKEAARSYVESYAGRIPNKAGSTLREAAYRDITDIFNAIDTDGSGFLDRVEVGEVAIILGFPLTAQELDQAFSQMDENNNGRVDLEEFETWWNHAKDNELHRKLSKELGIGGLKGEEIKTMGGGVFLG